MLTDDGAQNMPAHVTLLYPFADSATVAERVPEVEAVVRRFRPFSAQFGSLRRFEADPPVLYLAPEPMEPFVEMTNALVEAFPEHPPYGGVHFEIVPHLTVTHSAEADVDAISTELQAALPIPFRIDEVALMEFTGESGWQLRSAIRLDD